MKHALKSLGFVALSLSVAGCELPFAEGVGMEGLEARVLASDAIAGAFIRGLGLG